MEGQMEAELPAIRPSSQNDDATFQRRNAARQAAVFRGRAERKYIYGNICIMPRCRQFAVVLHKSLGAPTMD